jgi:3-oxoacyl-[acyl-carrier-protein] synthase II
MLRRVVITGLGPITGFGMGIEPLWQALIEGRSCLKRISRFDPSGFDCQIAGELSDELFDVRQVVPKSYRKATKVMARDIELAVGAAAAAVADAGLITKAAGEEAVATIAPGRFGCHIGAGLIAADIEELTAALHTARAADGSFDIAQWGAKGMENLTPLWLLKYLPNMLACHVTIIHDCRGPSNTITCAEASGLLSVGESLRVIRRGAAEACLSGGAESKINPMGLLRQHFAGRLAAVNGAADPADVVRPFEPAASGTILGEGGGIVVLESWDLAQRRGATVHAEVAGFGASQSFDDAGRIEHDSTREGLVDAARAAMRDARVEADQIDAVAPLASGIRAVDEAEAAAIRSIFGARAGRIPLITLIPNCGHCGAGAGAIALIVAAKAMSSQRLPKRRHGDAPAGGQPLNHVLVMTTSLGGQNAAVVLNRAPLAA